MSHFSIFARTLICPVYLFIQQLVRDKRDRKGITTKHFATKISVIIKNGSVLHNKIQQILNLTHFVVYLFKILAKLDYTSYLKE